MNGRGILFPTSLIAISALAIVPNAVHVGHGQLVGLVCLSPSSSPQCPATPVTISSPVGTQMSVYVLVQGSDIMNGFDIILMANHTIIKPAGASLSGGLVTGSPVIECIGGVSVAGTCGRLDTADTIELGIAMPFNVFAPVTGLLFTAFFNVTGTATTPISFQTGCTLSSVNETTTCVEITNGSTTLTQETVQAATYTAAPVPTFTIGPETSPTEIDIAKGESGNTTLLLTSVNGFSGTVNLSTALTPKVSHPPTISLSRNSVTLTNGGFALVVLSASAKNNTTKDSYTITVTGISGSQTGSVEIALYVFVA